MWHFSFFLDVYNLGIAIVNFFNMKWNKVVLPRYIGCMIGFES